MKYNNVRTEVDGKVFDSKKEARRYQTLKLLERAGEITDLECQPSFDLLAWSPEGAVKVGVYRADFRYSTTTGSQVIEDVKGGNATKTATYRLKKKLVEASHGIIINET